MAEEKFLTEVIKKLEEQNKILRDGLLKPKVPKKDASDREEEKEGAGKEKDKIDILKEIAKNTSMGGGGGGVDDDGKKLPKIKRTKGPGAIMKFAKFAGKMGLIGGALMLLIPALVAFFQSDMWKKIKKFFIDDFLPWAKMMWHDVLKPIAVELWGDLKILFEKLKIFFIDDFLPWLKMMWYDYLKPIGKMLWGQLTKLWKAIKIGFNDIYEGIRKLFQGDIIGGLKDIFLGIGKFLLSQLDIAFTVIYNLIAKIFGWKETDSVFGSIIGTFWKIYDWVFDTIDAAWKGIKSGISTAWTFIKDSVTGIFTKIKGWFTKMFNFSSMEKAIASLINIYTFIPNLIKDVVANIVSWFLDLLGFEDAAKTAANVTKWSIGSMVVTIFKKVKDWIVGIFSFAAAGIAKGWTNVTTFITGVWDKVITWFKDLWSWGEGVGKKIAGKFTGIVNYVKEVFGKIKGWFIGLFKWGTEAGKDKEGKWSLSTMVLAVIGKVKKWVIGLFTWAAKENKGDSWIVTKIKDVILGVKKWLGDLFKFDSTKGIIASLFNVVFWLPNLLMGGLKLVTTWLLSLFGFDQKAKDLANKKNWSIGGMIVTAFQKVKEWFLGIFGFGGKDGKGMTDAEKAKASKGFSLVGMLEDVITSIKQFFWHPDGKSGILQFDLTSALPDFKMPDLGKAVGKMLAGIFPDDWVLGTGIVGRAVKWAMPDSLTAMLKDIKGLERGGPFMKGEAFLAGEKGPEAVLPSTSGLVANSNLTQAILKAGLDRAIGGGTAGGGGGGQTIITNAPTVANTSYVDQTISTKRHLPNLSAIS